MNPKDMTKEELMTCLAEDWDRLGRTAFSDKFWDGGRLQQRVDDYKAELLRRLDEAVALRKENEELQNALEYIASCMWIDDVGDDETVLGLCVNKEALEEDLSINGLLHRNDFPCDGTAAWHDLPHPMWSQSITDAIKRAAKKALERINAGRLEAAKAKESEASHA